MNPNLTQKKLAAFCKSKDIKIVAYTPLGQMPESRSTKDTPAPHLDDPILTAMGKKYNKSTVQIVLRYLVCKLFIFINFNFLVTLFQNFRANKFIFAKKYY